MTRGMINKTRLNEMKATAYLINVGRGACVVLDDLVEALRSKTISGAGLDVFETEPLPGPSGCGPRLELSSPLMLSAAKRSA